MKTPAKLAAGMMIMALAMPAPAADTVATAVYARIGNGYSREQGKDGKFKPEYYALANGGRIFGTTGDITVDRVTYPQVAEIAMRLLREQNYHYAQNKEQAKLLVVLQWGRTMAFDHISSNQSVSLAGSAWADLQNALRAAELDGGGGVKWSGGMDTRGATGEGGYLTEAFESAMQRIFMDNWARDRFNDHNARVLGYMDELADSNDIRRWAGGGDRFTDLIGDVEESRYYIVISAFDFRELHRSQQKKLLWQVRVSVRSPGNGFDDSVAAMLKSASAYFGRDSGRLVRGEETKGTVELGDLKFLGEAKGKTEASPGQAQK